ncbi:MAG: hypothetical protein IPK80_25860 [Nannocystis sp.]|nr:hypothetical protein [Nannocystis sp.]
MRRGTGSARGSARVAVALGLCLCAGVWEARGDVMPEEELWGREIGARVEIAGVDRFAEHVFFIFPAYCTSALAALDGATLYFYDQDELAARPNYLVLRDGPLASWIGGNQSCQGSSIYALAREVAATIDLDAMSLEGLRGFFEGDSRLFRAGSSFQFLDTPLYADKRSPLQQVDEVVRVLRLDAEGGITAVVDTDTYSFADGTTQTLPLAHTRRPPLPFKPLKPAKIAKYVATHAKWLVRQPVTPPPAPRLPEFAEEEEGETGATGTTGTTGTDGGGERARWDRPRGDDGGGGDRDRRGERAGDDGDDGGRRGRRGRRRRRRRRGRRGRRGRPGRRARQRWRWLMRRRARPARARARRRERAAAMVWGWSVGCLRWPRW